MLGVSLHVSLRTDCPSSSFSLWSLADAEYALRPRLWTGTEPGSHSAELCSGCVPSHPFSVSTLPIPSSWFLTLAPSAPALAMAPYHATNVYFLALDHVSANSLFLLVFSATGGVPIRTLVATDGLSLSLIVTSDLKLCFPLSCAIFLFCSYGFMGPGHHKACVAYSVLSCAFHKVSYPVHDLILYSNSQLAKLLNWDHVSAGILEAL